ncbi:histone-like nucleoid-structuring protein, MvaT/MvaU family [Billgrantia antri]|uniref:histone-like nucleoid-structuring protein, MvaT/MvaU family n=1 Tax=Billgrantia antri TaxID=2846777 RepID=UPI0030842F77
MSSRLATYMEKEQLMKQLAEELKQLEQSGELKKELEFKEMLEALMREYSITSSELIVMLDPSRAEGGQDNQQRQRRQRRLKVYTNPHTGEVVETRGGNQKTLKAWKDQYGEETVEGWEAEAKQAAEGQGELDVSEKRAEGEQSKTQASKKGAGGEQKAGKDKQAV